MMIMPANNLSGFCHYAAGRFPGLVGMLNSPISWKLPPEYMPWALDNGCFTRWDPERFYLTLRRASLCNAPLWVCVPDAVADAETTFRRWRKHRDKVMAFGFRLAFVVQDGMEPQDVPADAFCCFVGGSTEWKLANAHKFKGVAKLLHIGRVSTRNRLQWAKNIGADSVDGTGFFRGDKRQLSAFIDFIQGGKQLCFKF